MGVPGRLEDLNGESEAAGANWRVISARVRRMARFGKPTWKRCRKMLHGLAEPSGKRSAGLDRYDEHVVSGRSAEVVDDGHPTTSSTYSMRRSAA